MAALVRFTAALARVCFAAGLLATLVSGCGGGSTRTPPQAPDGTQSTISIDRTTNVQASGVDFVNVTVTARDSTGLPIPYIFVTISSTGTGNVIRNPVNPTDINGIAVGTLATTVAETKTVSATLMPSGLAQRAVLINEVATVTFTGGSSGTGTTGTGGTGAPTVTSLSPANGPAGTAVTITGTGFTGATAVTFGTTSQPTFTVVSATEITTTVPTGASTGPVSVTTSKGTGTSTSSFTVGTGGGGGGGTTPTITSFSPTSGPVGTSVTITGTHLTGTTGVTFGTTPQTTLTVNSDTSVTAAVPAGATTGTISLVAPGGTATSSTTFTVTTSGGTAPTVTGFSPSSGAVGTAVTITGTNLTGATSVSFGGTSQTSLLVTNSTTIVTTVPTGAVTGTVGVTTPSGSGGSTATFTVTTATPTFTAFSPNTGAAGTAVTITGTNFGTTPTVSFDGTPQPTLAVNGGGTQITCDVPRGTGTGAITVTVGGTALVSSTVFTLPRGTFGSPAPISSAAITGIAVGDVNRNGKLDLALAVPTSNLIALLLGKGDGTFTAGTSVTDTASPGGLVLADMDNDGKLDLVVAERTGTSESLFLGDGAGGFGTAISIPLGITNGASIGGNSIAVGDFNGDGRLDVMTGVDANGMFGPSLRSNSTSPPTFTAGTLDHVVVPTPTFTAVVLGDFTHSGHVEAAAATDSGPPSRLTNDGSGTFVFGTGGVGTGAVVASLAAQDLNRDGYLDLVGADNLSSGNSSIYVFLNDQTGKFLTQASYSTNAMSSVGVAVGDVNGDGIPDVVTANGDGTVSVLLGVGDGTFQTAVTTPGVSGAITLVLADMNGDGKLDIVVAGPHGAVILLGN